MSVKESQELKQLESRQTKLEAQLKAKKEEKARVSKELVDINNQNQSVIADIKRLKSRSKTPVVTEHAVLRYMERAMGLDVELVHNEILSKDVVTMIDKLGNGKFPIGDGLKAVVRNRTVVTVTN